MGKSIRNLLGTLYHQMMNIYDDQHMIKYWRSKGAKIGKNVAIYNSNIDRGHISLIEIGDNVTITNCTIMAHDASMHIWTGKSKIGRVKIGNNVFVGYGSMVMPGITIGNNVVIGAHSLVLNDIPDNSVAVGSPARVISTHDAFLNKVKSEMEVLPVFDTYWRDKTEEQIKEMTEKVIAAGGGYDA